MRLRPFSSRRVQAVGRWLCRHRGVIGRRLLWVLPLFFLLMGLLNWFHHRPLPSRGGLYFFKEVRLEIPWFAQGDPEWKADLLGPTEATLHAEGCAVASAAMVMAGYGVEMNPGTLNAFLTEHEGYTEEGWIYWEKAAEFRPGVAEKAYEDLPSYARIDWNLLRGNPVIIRVRLPMNNHFVVIVGKRGWDYLILDPGAVGEKGAYPLSELAPRIEALRYYRRLPEGSLLPKEEEVSEPPPVTPSEESTPAGK